MYKISFLSIADGLCQGDPFHHRKIGQGEVLLLHLAAKVLAKNFGAPLCLPLVADHEMESSASPLPRHCGVDPGAADSVLPGSLPKRRKLMPAVRDMIDPAHSYCPIGSFTRARVTYSYKVLRAYMK